MTPHGPPTSSTGYIRPARNPYDELASPDAPDLPRPSMPNPYEALASGGAGRPQGDRYRGAGGDGAADYGPYGSPYGPGTGEGSDGSEGSDDSGGPLGFALRSDYDDGSPGPGGPGGAPDEDRMPYLRAVRRRRRSRIGRAAKTAVAVLVLLAFLVVGDRWAALYADDKAAAKVQQALKLHAEPEVHIRGFPFLTQLADDRLDHVDVTIPDMPAGRVSVAQVKGTVRDVRIVGGAPSAIKGAVLGRMHGAVLLDFDDLDRELGTSQVAFTSGGGNTVRAKGQLPVAGRQVKVRARAHLRRTSDYGVGTTVDDMRLDVPGLFSYTPGKNGGLRLARPLAHRVQRDAAQAKALFRVGSVAKRFGLTPQRARLVRQSEQQLHQVTGQPLFVDKLMKINMLDVLMEHPWLLQRIGIDPGLVGGLKKIEEPKLAKKLSLSTRLPKVPGDVRLRGISVTKDGIRARLTGVDVPVGGGDKAKKPERAKKPEKTAKGKHEPAGPRR